MKAHLSQIQGSKFRAQAEDGPAIILHSPDEGEIRDGPSPMQTALLAAMGCTAGDIVSILEKERAKVTGLEIDAEAERATKPPRVFTKVHLHYKIHGDGIRKDAVERAIELSTERYCSVGIMLRRGGVEWLNTYEILPSR